MSTKPEITLNELFDTNNQDNATVKVDGIGNQVFVAVTVGDRTSGWLEYADTPSWVRALADKEMRKSSELTLEELEELDASERQLVEVDDIDDDSVQLAYGDRTTDWVDYGDLPDWLQDEVDSTMEAHAAADAESRHERSQLYGGRY